MADHYLVSVGHLETAKAARSRIAVELSRPQPNQQKITHAAAADRAQMKLAEVHALLAIVQRLDERRLAS